jgi:hypothetical protein
MPIYLRKKGRRRSLGILRIRRRSISNRIIRRVLIISGRICLPMWAPIGTSKSTNRRRNDCYVF